MISTTTKTLVSILIALIMGGAVWFAMAEKDTVELPDEPRACTKDAMQCPDGPIVGRTGPNCEFVCPEPAPTPTPSPSVPVIPPQTGTPEPVFCTMDAMMCPDGTWVGRTGPNCEFLCPSE